MTLPLDPEQWRRLDGLLDELLDLSGEDRQQRLSAIEADDPDLARQLQQFLDDARAAGDFLSAPAAETAAALIDDATRQDAPEARLGQRLGPWELTGILGEGGMGVVYEARRADGQYEATAAVKLMLAVDHESPLRSRLLAERQMLAQLDDPRIAHLYDGGISEDGHPYLVMERVEGHDILTHCREHKLGLNQRITLFREVCAAVGAAHQQMILHCDLKPGNIMVTESGELKLLDFGVARSITESPDAASGQETGAGTLAAQLLTPDYASPEQRAGQKLTAASDVFALGILLHEMLTGAKPQANVDPLEAAANQPWASRLRGDLDNILRKTLQTEIRQRYRTVQELDEDLERWQGRYPVNATPSTPWYRLRRRIDRNRLASAAVAVVILAVLTGLSTTMWQARVASQQRDQALRESARAQTVSAFLLDLFTVADPNENIGADLTARDILERGRDQLVQLESTPAQKIALQNVLADVYFRLGLFEDSRDLYLAELEDLTQLDGNRAAEIADARLDLAVALIELGDTEAATEQVERCLAYRQTHPQPDPEWLAIPRSIQARIATEDRDFVQAAAIYREVLAELDTEDPDLQAPLARSWTNFGVALDGLGRLAAADSAYAQALVHFQEAYPEHHSYYGSLYNNWALVVHSLGDLERAEELHGRALQIRRTLKHNRVDIGASLINLGNLLVESGRPAEALPLLREAVDIQREAFGGDHVYVAAAEINLGLAHLALGDAVEADGRFIEGEAIFRRLYGDDNPALAVALIRRGQAARAADRLDRAAEFLSEGLAMHRRHLPNFKHKYGEALLELAEVESLRGLDAAAVELAAEAVKVIAETAGPEHELVARAQKLLVTSR